MGPFSLKLPAALLAMALCAQGQFSNLAVTDDGSQVYFATNLRLVSEASQNVPDGSAIYRIANGAITRVTTPSGFNPLPYHAYSQGNPQISADKRLFSYTEYNNCYGGSACITFPSSSTSHLLLDGAPYGQPLKGEAQISRNGRFVLTYLTSCCAIPPQPPVIQYYDLQAGTTVQVPLPPSARRQALTSAGTALLLNSQTGSLALWTPQSSSKLATSVPAKSAILDDAGTWVIYEASSGTTAQLRAFAIATGQDIVLASRSVEFWTAPVFGSSIGTRGNLVVYVASPQPGQPVQVWRSRPDGTNRRQLSNFAQDVSEAVMTGDGRTVVAVTGGRMVSIDLIRGGVRDLIGATPTCYPGVPAPSAGVSMMAPGSLYSLKGTALAGSTATATPPLPDELAGAQVLMNGKPLPLLSVSPVEVWFQVPFEAPSGTNVTLSVAYGSPFQGCSVEIPISGRSPYLIEDSTGSTIVMHQGFSGQVTPQSPAKAGEVVTLYALGLGGVSPPVPTGAATPFAPLSPLNWPFACYQGSPYDNGASLDVPFAGLAPGLVGTYQVNIRMPDPLPAGNFLVLNCGTPGNNYERGGGAIATGGPG
jgi:uncharacterized protein (TIGR03437 family)